MTAPMVDYKIHWLKMMSVPESQAVVGRADGINGRDSLKLGWPIAGGYVAQFLRRQTFDGVPTDKETKPFPASQQREIVR